MAHSKLYVKLMNSKQWREFRVQRLRANPLCQWCEANGYVVAAREIHHIREVESARTEIEARELCFSWSNTLCLCHRCHSEHHRQQRYHSKEVINERNEQRLSAWADSLTSRFTSDPSDDNTLAGRFS